MKSHSIEDLNQIYNDADSVDSATFAEQRSNILLTSGEHYNKRSSRYWNRIRDSRNLSEEQKVRITKNHIQRIVKTYVNNIISHAPGVQPVPKNEREMQDIKAAQLSKSVWHDICDRFDMKAEIYEDAKDFIGIGEVACKIFWDENAGKFLGWQAEIDAEGQHVVGEDGQMVASKIPLYSGDLVFERVYGMNLLRSKEAKSMKDNHCWIIRKMADIEEMKLKVSGDAEKLKYLQASSDETYLVFEGGQTGYKKSDKQVMIREFYYKPCYQYPMGYYYITTSAGILWQGELPLGVFPIIYTGFDSAQTSPRHFSIIKHVRPSQVEINRASSKVVEHQISTGDDKLLIQSGTKLTSGGTLPGIRGVQYTGMKPEILQGRTGDQYGAYILATIDEMYKLANLAEDSEAAMKQADPLGTLFLSLRDKKKYAIYAEKFERYQIAKCRLGLTLAKAYYDEKMLVPAIGKNELVNISEFKNTNELSYEIELKPLVDDIETMFGKQVVMNTALQYAGNKLEKEDIGRIIRNMPFGNADESFSDLTLDYDMATNMILALDRGEQPQMSQYDNNKYMIKRLIARVRQSDFKSMQPAVQQNYMGMIQMYEQQEAMQQMKIQEAQSGFIPSGGAKVKADYYVSAPNNPNKVERATLPAEAVDWLIRRLAEQGSSQDALQQQTQGAIVDIAGYLKPTSSQQMPQTQPIPPAPQSEYVQTS